MGTRRDGKEYKHEAQASESVDSAVPPRIKLLPPLEWGGTKGGVIGQVLEQYQADVAAAR